MNPTPTFGLSVSHPLRRSEPSNPLPIFPFSLCPIPLSCILHCPHFMHTPSLTNLCLLPSISPLGLAIHTEYGGLDRLPLPPPIPNTCRPLQSPTAIPL
jgi:hypothetical protein